MQAHNDDNMVNQIGLVYSVRNISYKTKCE